MPKKGSMAAQGPLVGLRVLEVGMLFAGSTLTANLADLGADVIKVEPPKGDEVKTMGHLKDGEGLWWRVIARGKRIISVDIGKPEGAAIVRQLALQTDILVENFRAGRMQEWGLGYEELSCENPGLVMLHISGYGQTGPYHERPGMGTLAEAFSGFAHNTGEADGNPTLPAFPFADGVTAMTGAYSVLAALYARDRNGGKGDEIDLSLYEPLLSLMGSMVIDYDQTGFISRRKGNRSIWNAPRNAFRTRDEKWVVVAAAANSVAPRLFRAIGRDDWATDPSLATNAGRVKRNLEIDGVIAQWIAERPIEEVLKRFHEYEVVAAPINDVAQIFEDPHVQARKTLTELDDPALGKIRMQNVVPKFTRAPGAIRWPGRRETGSDTEQVLKELGYGQAEIEHLERNGLIKTAPES